MSQNTSELEQLLATARTLSPLDRVWLVEQVMETLKSDLAPTEKKPKRSLYGIWAGTNVSEEDIDEARREMWGNFPREDI